MSFKKLIILILLNTSFFSTFGCMKKVTNSEPEKYFLSVENTRVRVKGYSQWIKVVKVKDDSVYVEIPEASNSAHNSIVSFPLNSLIGIEKTEIDVKNTLISGIVIGGLVSYIILSIHLIKEFDTEDEIF